MCVVSDLSETSQCVFKTASASLGADGKRQTGALIYRLLLIKLILFEMKHPCLAANKRVLGDKSDNTQGEINADMASKSSFT